MPTEDAYYSGHLVLSHMGFANVFCWDHWHSIIHYTSLWHLSLTWLFTEFDVITEYRFPYGICNGCGMPTGDAYSSGHLVLSHFRTCICSNVETNLSCFRTFWVSNIPRYFCFAWLVCVFSIYRANCLY